MCPWRDLNPRTRLRRPVLYPLSYRGKKLTKKFSIIPDKV